MAQQLPGFVLSAPSSTQWLRYSLSLEGSPRSPERTAVLESIEAEIAFAVVHRLDRVGSPTHQRITSTLDAQQIEALELGQHMLHYVWMEMCERLKSLDRPSLCHRIEPDYARLRKLVRRRTTALSTAPESDPGGA